MKKKSSRNRVSFGVVRVREYERVAGDHPDVSSGGPPLGLGWRFVQNKDIQVDEQVQECSTDIAPLNAETRRFLLFHVFEISKQDIEKSERLSEDVRMQRRESYWEWKQSQEVPTSKFWKNVRADWGLKRKSSCRTPSPKQSSKKVKSPARLNGMKRSFTSMRPSLRMPSVKAIQLA